MLAVQVSYWTMVENKRHNLVTEKQNDQNIQIAQRNAYTNWYNAQTSRFSAEENQRHNITTEQISMFNANENQRHNLAIESLTGQSNEINLMNAFSNRMNAETNRSKLQFDAMNAQANLMSGSAALQNAQTNEMNAFTNKWKAQQDVIIAQEKNDILRFQSVTGYQTGYGNMLANQQNAQTNEYNAYNNAERNRIQEDYNKQYFQLQDQKLELDRSRLALDTFDVFSDAINNAWRNSNVSRKQKKQTR